MLKMTPKTNKYLCNAIQNNNSLKPNKTLKHSKSEIYRKKTPINNCPLCHVSLKEKSDQ